MKLNYGELNKAIPSISISKEIDAEGKHILDFDKNFPMSSFLYSFKYDFKLTPSYHDYLELGYIVEGKGVLNIENKKFIVKKDDLIVLGNHELHTWAKYKNEGFVILVIFFLPELVFKAGGIEVDFEYLKPFLFRNKSFKNVIHPYRIDTSQIAVDMKKIYELVNYKNQNYEIESKTLLTCILLKLFKYYEKADLKADKSYIKKQDDMNRLKDLMAYLQKEYRSGITLNEAAKKANMSLHYFCKFFKKVVGQNFSNYLLSIKIDKAKEFLLTGKLTVAGAAYESGFGNLSYFYRKFKEFTGSSPKEFKQISKKFKKLCADNKNDAI